jgi:hypothetical protein
MAGDGNRSKDCAHVPGATSRNAVRLGGSKADFESIALPIAHDLARPGVEIIAVDALPERTTPRSTLPPIADLSEILDWFTQMAGAVDTSWLSPDE